MKRRIYISGPMSGLPNLNFDAFNDAAARLRSLGWDVVNPVDVDAGSADWLNCIAADLQAMRGCTAIGMLPGWETSFGARIERLAAEKLGLEFYDVADLLQAEAA